jgi:hypothetical protein
MSRRSRNEVLRTDTFEKSHLGPVDSLDELPVGGVTGRSQRLILFELEPLGSHTFVHLDDLAIEHIGLAVSVSLRFLTYFLDGQFEQMRSGLCANLQSVFEAFGDDECASLSLSL